MNYGHKDLKIIIVPPDHVLLDSLLILDHSYLVGNLTNSNIAETKALEPLKSWHFCISNFWTCWFPNEKMSGPRLGALSNNRWSGGRLQLRSENLQTYSVNRFKLEN